MKKMIAIIVAVMMVSCAMAQVKQTVTKSAITYKVKNMGINTGGSIGGLQADIVFDKDQPETSSIQASVDVNALDSENEMRDNHMKSADYFNAAKYPKITMKSVSIKHKSGNNYLGTFNVTIKDKTKTVDVPFTYTTAGTTANFKGSFKIFRTDFGIGDKGLVLADDVTIFIDIQTTQ